MREKDIRAKFKLIAADLSRITDPASNPQGLKGAQAMVDIIQELVIDIHRIADAVETLAEQPVEKQSESSRRIDVYHRPRFNIDPHDPDIPF